MVAQGFERLFARRRFGMKPGLELIRAIAAELGNPQDRFAVLHVAGTNGKGSVCALTESVLRAAGLKVGLYTSPHLVRFNERFRIDGVDVDDARLAAAIDRVERAAAAVATADREATFFECATAAAFLLFAEAGVRVAVVETGLGGRLDATNIVQPLVSCITPVDFDHMDVLGATLPAIAAEKGGIIKPGRPVVLAAMAAEARAVLGEMAAACGAPVVEAATAGVVRKSVGPDGQKVQLATAEQDYGTLRLPLHGDHQCRNLATATMLLETFAAVAGVALTPALMKRGVAAVRWPGRLQVLERDPLVLLDGAHNPAGIETAVRALRTLGGGPVALVFAACEDKDLEGMLKLLRVVDHLWAVRVAERGLEAGAIAAAAGRHGIAAEPAGLPAALAAARAHAAARGGCVLVAGSLYLAGEVLALRERCARDAGERG